MSVTATDPTTITFATRPGGNTWLELDAPSDDLPTDLLAELADIGWSDVMSINLGDRTAITINGPRGSQLFGLWSTAEARSNKAAAAKVLATFGYSKVPTWHKTLQDML